MYSTGPKQLETSIEDNGLPASTGSRADLLDLVKNSSITMGDIRNLNLAGFHSIESVAHSTRAALCKIKGISESKAIELLRATTTRCKMGFVSALDVMISREDIVQITTGSRAVDSILDGGIEAGCLTELFGESRTGKTQLCSTLAVTCQLPIEKGGGGGKCIYIDTENSFRPERLIEIAKRFGISEKQVLANVLVAKCHNTDHQLSLIKEAARIMSDGGFSLIVIDSITHLYRSEYTGREELALRQQHLAHCLRTLHDLTNVYNIACVLTNQMVDIVNQSQGSSFSRMKSAPVGGNIIAHASTNRLYLKRLGENLRKCRVYESPYLPDREGSFVIGSEGIVDTAESGT